MYSSPLKNPPRAMVLGLLTAILLSIGLSHRLIRSALAGSPAIESNVSQLEASASTGIADRYGELPLRFEPNEGQTDERVKFLSRGPGYDLFLTATGAVISLRKPNARLDQPATSANSPSNPSDWKVSILRLQMIGANSKARVEGEDELPGKINYLIGDDPEKWHSNIPTYTRVQYKEIFPGVDMVYYGNQRQLEYDFVVAPHADPRVVKFSVEGAQKLRIDGNGDLVISIDDSEVRLRKPVIYQITDQPLRLNEFLPDTQQIGQGVVVGVGNWQTLLENNKVAFALDFVSRSRFTTAHPTTLTPLEFVDALFAHAGVTPSATDRNAAINEFGTAGDTADTAARGRALRRVAENSTLKQQEFNRAFVLMQYFGYLRRNPNDAPEPGLNFDGYNFWLGKLNQFNGNYINAEMVKAFITAGEYRQRFGP